ncbi:hypothetical protein OAK75_07830 [Bacteriovoracales bacterium]|nr:hypothetical protein [Bacteriovoracales bacterium]
MKSHLRVLFTFILSFQLCWSPLNVYSQESSATGSQDYAGETIDNPYLSTQSTSKTLEEQKSECLEISSKIWDESLNRCINKQGSVDEREKFKECEAITDLTERNTCLEELRKKQIGDMKEENPVAWLGTSGAVVSTLTLIAINLAAKETGGVCLSKKILTAAALAHLVSEAYNYFYAEKELRELREAYSETVNDEQKAYDAQLKALEFLKEEQQTIASVAGKKKIAYSLVAGLYGAALLAAVWELTPWGTAGACIGGAPPTGGTDAIPTGEHFQEPLPKNTFTLLQEEEDMLNSFFIYKEAQGFSDGKFSSPTLQSYNQAKEDNFFKSLEPSEKDFFKQSLVYALKAGQWMENQLIPNAHALGASSPIGMAVEIGGAQVAGAAQSAGQTIVKGAKAIGPALKSGAQATSSAAKSAATSVKASAKALPGKIQNAIKSVKSKIKFIADSRVIAVFAGIAGSISSYLAIHTSMQEKQATKNVDHTETVIVKFKESMQGHCPEGRDNMGDARCYCYTSQGQKNQNRNKSETCISMWKRDRRNPFKDAKVYGTLSRTELQQACVTINQRFDPNCRCKKYKDQKTGNNACYKVNPYIKGYGPLGQSATTSQIIQSANSMNQGNLSTGKLNSTDFVRAAARFKKGAGKLLKSVNKNLLKKGQSPIPVSDAYTKKFLKANVSPKVISMAKAMSTTPAKSVKGPAGNIIKKMAKKAGIKVASAGPLKPTATQTGTPVEELNFDLDTKTSIKPKIVEDFLDKKYKIDQEQIVKREDVSIWKVITNRYNVSALPRLFGDD